MGGVTSDHRKVQPGMTFVAIRGSQADGHEYLLEAEKRGAIHLVGERPQPPGLTVPYEQVADSRLALAERAAQEAGYPSDKMLLVGVTGTSGKTTTTYLIESILTSAGKRVGLIGTVEIRFGGRRLPSTHTTPGPVELQAILREMHGQGCEAVVMEVSSHALSQRRVWGVTFDATAFLNLSPEHLDYHKDMEEYFRAKLSLFTEYSDYSRMRGKEPVATFNLDDPWPSQAHRLLQARGARTSTCGMNEGSELSGAGWTVSKDGVSGRIRGVPFQSELPGRYNASNILCAASVGLSLGLSPEQIARGIEQMKFVPGRMQGVPNSLGCRIWVDYAHKPDALEKVLMNLQEDRKQGRLHVVFGCGGDRDRAKRPEMARIAEKLADHVVVTSDNPRSEKPEAIIAEICSGFRDVSQVQVIVDRRRAIEQAIRMMRKGDFLVIAGKGHETYQEVQGQRLPFDDVEEALQALTRISNTQ